MSSFQQRFVTQLVKKLNRQTFLSAYSLQQLLHHLQSRGLRQFLLMIGSSQLRQALREKQELEDTQAYEQTQQQGRTTRMNVMDFTVKELVFHCRANGLIDYNHYKNYETMYGLKNHYELGMRLVERVPLRYYVGERSNHFNAAGEIELMYGIHRRRAGGAPEPEERGDGGLDEGGDLEEQGDEIGEFEEIERESEGLDGFVVEDDQELEADGVEGDDEEQSGDESPQSEQQSFIEQLKQNQMLNSMRTASKKKRILKSRNKNQPLRRLSKFKESDSENQSISECIGANEDEVDQESSQEKPEKRVNLSNITQKKNVIDSD